MFAHRSPIVHYTPARAEPRFNGVKKMEDTNTQTPADEQTEAPKKVRKPRKSAAPKAKVPAKAKGKKVAKPAPELYAFRSGWTGPSDGANTNLSRTKIDPGCYNRYPQGNTTERDDKNLRALRDQFGVGKTFERRNLDAGIIRRLMERGYLQHKGGSPDATDGADSFHTRTQVIAFLSAASGSPPAPGALPEERQGFTLRVAQRRRRVDHHGRGEGDVEHRRRERGAANPWGH